MLPQRERGGDAGLDLASPHQQRATSNRDGEAKSDAGSEAGVGCSSAGDADSGTGVGE
jgi:hypothetical protein